MPFVCSVCGERHDTRLLDIRLGLPDDIHALDDGERRRRAWLADDFAVLDETRCFVRGLLELPIPELDARFAFGAWVEVVRERFTDLMRGWHDVAQFEPAPCVLANELEPYRGTVGLAATLRPVSVDALPLIELADAPHVIVDDQRRGITAARSDELAAVVLHRL